jgi:VanZ family protein
MRVFVYHSCSSRFLIKPSLLTLIVSIITSVADELYQGGTPTRVTDARDAMADIVGSLSAVVIFLLFKGYTKWNKKD